MKKTIILFASICLLVSCKSFLMNVAFQSMGVYDDEATIKELNTIKKKTLFIPMHHVGTPNYYKDVAQKVDSLNKLGYFFYYELIQITPTNKESKEKLIEIVKKRRKITGIPYVDNKTSVSNNDKIKFKKEVITQPSWKNLGLDSLNSKNVDSDFKSLISAFETKYGEIILDPCDLDTKITERTNCKVDKNRRNIFRKEYILDYRNKHAISTLQRDTIHPKIVIIYGAEHYNGMQNILNNYKEN